MKIIRFAMAVLAIFAVWLTASWLLRLVFNLAPLKAFFVAPLAILSGAVLLLAAVVLAVYLVLLHLYRTIWKPM